MEVERGIGKSGVVGIIRGAWPGPVIGIRADMDALPIQEENEHPYVSKTPGKMHACGHDGHIAMGLGAAMLLARRRQELSGTVVLIFQPGEEGWHGAKAMIDDGVLVRHQVEALSPATWAHCLQNWPWARSALLWSHYGSSKCFRSMGYRPGGARGHAP